MQGDLIPQVAYLQYWMAILIARFYPPPPPPPPPPPLGTVTKSIGTTGRDYSTVTLWEADLDGASYASGDTALGEGYNDSAFDEAVTINGGGTVGLAARILSVASGQRHNGTAGTGTRFVRSAAGNPLVIAINSTTIQWWDINCNGKAVQSAMSADTSNRASQRYLYNLIHGTNNATSGSSSGINFSTGTSTSGDALRNIIYNLTVNLAGSQSVAGISCTASSGTINVDNNTVHNLVRNSGTGICTNFSFADDNSFTIKNNIGTDPSGTTSGTKACFNTWASAVNDHNLSSDATASGTGSLTSKTSANQFVSTSVGSEDLHLKAGADAIGAGTTIGSSPTGVDTDIDGVAVTGTWDMGADQTVAAAGGPFPHFTRRLMTGGMIQSSAGLA